MEARDGKRCSRCCCASGDRRGSDLLETSAAPANSASGVGLRPARCPAQRRPPSLSSELAALAPAHILYLPAPHWPVPPSQPLCLAQLGPALTQADGRPCRRGAVHSVVRRSSCRAQDSGGFGSPDSWLFRKQCANRLHCSWADSTRHGKQSGADTSTARAEFETAC